MCRERARGIAAVRTKVGRVVEVPSRSGHVDLGIGLQKLAEAGLTTVLIEGGGGLAAALLRANLVDEVHWMLAPMLIGSEGRSGLGPLELAKLSDAVSIDPLRVARRGRDIHLHGLIERTPSDPAPGKTRPKGRQKDAKR
jgi:diaminohydroxyphosphoribosylaminopyrimidine deaminase/5-amino-6-(5-phosphoribosylamino)uracil reductase